MIESTIGHYRVLAKLGAGGMGVVHRALDERLGREVALKVLLPGSADSTARARLLREARMASSLNHPNICHVYEVGEGGGTDYIAMELVEGKSLRDRIREGGLPVEEVIRVGAEVADALAHAHERGIIHRDLKSGNVMIGADGRAKVLDFGLAKRTEARPAEGKDPSLRLTESGIVVGTPAYLAPEVLNGEAAGAASDLWALGVVLFEMAAGSLPFSGRSVIDVCASILNDPPATLPAHVPPGLRSVIQRLLEKEPGRRYRAASEVRAALEALREDSGATARPGRSAWQKPPLVAAGALALGALLVLGFDLGGVRTRLSGGAGTGGAGSGIRSLAVLPLANLSGDPAQEYFADGITEELIAKLASIASLKVISRTSVMQYKATTKALPVIARELGVDGIIEGSVARSGDRVRVTAQLIDAPRDRHVWAESYERDVKDVLALQKDVAMSIAREIRLQLTVEEMARMASGRPIRPEAYELCLKGRYNLAKVTDASVRKGIEYFQEAIAVDPGAAAAYSGLADGHILLAQLISTEPIPVAMPIAKENAKKALELDDSSADAHATMGMALFFGDRDWEASERHLKRAIELNPGHARMRFYYSVRLGAEGRSEEAVREVRKAVELDPLALIVNWALAAELVLARRYEEALVQARKTHEIEPGSILGPSSILRTYEAMGRYPEAIETIEKYFSSQPGAAELVEALRKGLASDGAKGFWRAYLGWRPPPEMGEHTPASFTAILAAQAGEVDAAFASLEQAFEAGEGGVLWLPSDPGYDPIRKDPRYEALLRRLKVPPRP